MFGQEQVRLTVSGFQSCKKNYLWLEVHTKRWENKQVFAEKDILELKNRNYCECLKKQLYMSLSFVNYKCFWLQIQ